jgi:DNA mismatch repair protein MutS
VDLSTGPGRQPAAGHPRWRRHRPGFDAELDELRGISDNAADYLLQIEARERENTGIDGLKVGYNRVHGYYIELARSQSERGAAHYQRRQTLKNVERYITAELKAVRGQAPCPARAAPWRGKRRSTTASSTPCAPTWRPCAPAPRPWRNWTCSPASPSARTALEFCRPSFQRNPCCDIDQGRHPVVEQVLDEPFIANDTLLDEQRACC